jgi:Interferon-induced transmembrane protein
MIGDDTMKCGNCGAEASIGALRCEFCDHALIQDVSATAALPSTKPTSNVPPPPDSNPYESYNASQPSPPPPAAAPPPSPQYSAPSSQASSPRESYAAGTVPNNLILAIIATVCCGCMPLGVVAIVYAAQVDGKLSAGDYAGAVKSAENAKLFSMISIGLGVVGILGYMALVFIGMLGSASGM